MGGQPDQVGARGAPVGGGAVSDYDAAVLRGAALMDAYAELTGEQEPVVEDLLVDLLAYRSAGEGK